MTTLAKNLRIHREAARTRRAINRALELAGSDAARDDIISAWQHAEGTVLSR